jgi:hypothetical protein
MVDLCGGVFDHGEEQKERLRSCPDAAEATEAAPSPVPAGKWTLQRMKDGIAFLSE